MAATQVNLQSELKNKRICRFCLSQSEPLTNIYSRKSSAPLPVQIMTCASIEVFTNDGLPNTVCDTCRELIEHYYRFKEMCKKADTVLRQHPSTGIWPQPLDIPQMSEQFILRRHPNLCRKPKRESISSVATSSTAQPSAVESTSGVIQKPKARPTGGRLLTKKTNVYQFRIAIRRLKPPIWRRVQVPETYSFWDLHRVIQNVMGWSDYHLHKFEMINPETGTEDLIAIPFGVEDTIPEKTAKIAKYFLSPNDKASYEYDFGFSWDFEIILEKILPAVTGMQYPQCTAGKMASPLEDPTESEEEDLDLDDPVKFDPKSIKFDKLEEL